MIIAEDIQEMLDECGAIETAVKKLKDRLLEEYAEMVEVADAANPER